MSAFQTAKAVLGSDGVLYANRSIMPAAEGDLFNAQGQDPFAIPYQEAIAAKITFEIQGNVLSNAAYVVMQTDMGEGIWFDVAWCNFSGIAGPMHFYMSAGIAGVLVFQQTRQPGTTPTPSNSGNQMCLGGRIRFVGKATVGASSSSSSSSGAPAPVPAILVSLRYKLLALR